MKPIKWWHRNSERSMVESKISMAGQLMFCNLELSSKFKGARLLLSNRTYRHGDKLMSGMFFLFLIEQEWWENLEIPWQKFAKTYFLTTECCRVSLNIPNKLSVTKMLALLTVVRNIKSPHWLQYISFAVSSGIWLFTETILTHYLMGSFIFITCWLVNLLIAYGEITCW